MKKKSQGEGKDPKKKAFQKKAPARPTKKNAAKAATRKTKPKQELSEIESTDNPKRERTKLSGSFILRPTKPKRTGITQITIENFKGIADKVEIPIRPITLLFGANSAGKSTILQALLYLSELLEGRNADSDHLAQSGTSVDLGGFREFVHNRDLSRKVRIGVTLRLDDDGLPETRQMLNPAVPEYNLTSPEADHVRDVTVTVEVAWSHHHGKPFITSYEVALDGISFAAIHAQPGFEAHLDFINPKHPVFWVDEAGVQADEATNLFGALQTIYLDHNGAATASDCSADMRERQRLSIGRSVIPDFVLGLPDAWSYQPQGEEEAWGAAWLVALLSRTLVGAGSLLMEELRGVRYIGPIRRIPERSFQALRSPGADRWADGSGAWDLICMSDSSHHWLDSGAIRALGLGLNLEQYRFYEVPVQSCMGVLIDVVRASSDDSNHEGDREQGIVPREIRKFRERSRLQLVSESSGLELQPSDVGIGVSQVMPVALGAMAPGCRILAVEQPELHIHPAIQCNLGDLLAAQAIKDEGRTILLETHSEHIILRMLRRIRENTENELPEGAPELMPEHLSVLWVEQDEGVVSIKPIPANSQGDFDEQWPKGFFEERANELF